MRFCKLFFLMTLLNGSALANDDPLAAIDQLLAQQPRHQGALYYGARSAARRGQLERALSYLTQLQRSGFDDALELNDFPALHEHASFKALAAAFEQGASAQGNATPFAETQCADLLPEGSAYDPKRGELLISSGHLRAVFAVNAEGVCRNLVREQNSGLLAVLGMQVDALSDSVWLANTHAPFMKNVSESSSGQSQLSRLDLASGKIIAHYPLPPNGLANDLTLRPNGDVLVTESIAGAIYRLPKNQKALETLLPAATFEGPNGIVSLTNGDVVVADFNGLHLVSWQNSDTPKVTRLSTPDDRYLGGIDGITREGNVLVAIQNLVGRGRVWSFEIDRENQRVMNLQLRLRKHPDLYNPTTGVIANHQFYFVADPEWQQNNTPQLKPMPAGRRGHRILQIPLK